MLTYNFCCIYLYRLLEITAGKNIPWQEIEQITERDHQWGGVSQKSEGPRLYYMYFQLPVKMISTCGLIVLYALY